jgi:hypothetical protein
MPDLYALTDAPLPPAVLGDASGCSIRLLSEQERIAIEDHLSPTIGKYVLESGSTALVVPQSRVTHGSLEDFAVVSEFALAVVATEGYQPISAVATFADSKCTKVLLRNAASQPAAKFPRRLTESAASAWFGHVLDAQQKLKGNLHITADRYMRYLKAKESRDGLVDLCISLESLMDSQTEISFRFGICLAKIAKTKDARDTAALLSNLYDLRSKVVHGSDPSKAHSRIESDLKKLRQIARSVLTIYILYLAEHTRADWLEHLRESIFK